MSAISFLSNFDPFEMRHSNAKLGNAQLQSQFEIEKNSLNPRVHSINGQIRFSMHVLNEYLR